MKKALLYFSAIALCCGTSVSCDDVLNIDPSDRFSPASVWENSEALEQYVYGFYALLKEKVEVYDAANFTDAYSDIMKSGSWDQYNHAYNYALLQEAYFNSDSAGPFECWSNNYGRIRRHNEFLRDAPDYISLHGEEFITRRMAEVRFMRAFAYYQLIRVYGGVVLRTAVDGPAENDKPRASEEESWNLVISDLEYAGKNLPESWDDEYTGRVTKAAAYGLLSRVALYAKKWDRAVSAADSCALYGGKLAANYADIFNNADNEENILVVRFMQGYSNTGLSHRADQFFRPIGDKAAHGDATLYGAFGPTSELVDSYEVQNADGEWVDFSWDDFENQRISNPDLSPYDNRDPRFYTTVLYNGASWEGRTIDTKPGGADGLIEFNTSGAAGATCTGYYFKKYITENETGWDTKGSSHFGIILRYAEVLLNKAEALAELDDISGALSVLNEIRGRVGLPAKSASSRDEFMELLRHERMVELAGEGFRYWDLRRWRLAEDVINGQCAHGVKITQSGDRLNYEQIEVDDGLTRVFYDRYYAFSIPVSERANNTLCGDNNPGW